MALLLLKLFLIAVLVLIGAIILVNLAGLLFRKKLKVSVTNSYFHPLDHLWQSVNDTSTHGLWRAGIKKVEENQEGLVSWKEFFVPNGNHQLNVINKADEERIDLQLTGRRKKDIELTRSYVLWQKDYMSFLRVEDELVIHKPYLRTLATLFYNPATDARQSLQQLDSFLDQTYGSPEIPRSILN